MYVKLLINKNLYESVHFLKIIVFVNQLLRVNSKHIGTHMNFISAQLNKKKHKCLFIF